MTMGHQNRKISFSSGLKNKTTVNILEFSNCLNSVKINCRSMNRTQKQKNMLSFSFRTSKMQNWSVMKQQDFETIPKINPRNLI